MIREIVVVEGKNDTKRLRSFFDLDTIETHGMSLNEETIELIRQLNEKRGVILFLDPDSPGEKIRDRLNKQIPGLKNAFVMKEDARTKKKVGIEHASKEVLADALKNLITYGDCEESLSREDFIKLGLSGREDSAAKRNRISSFFHLGKCNAKTLYKRINLAGITCDQIKEVL